MARILNFRRTNQLDDIQRLRSDVDQLRAEVWRELQRLGELVNPVAEQIAGARLRIFLDAMHKIAHLKINAELPAALSIAAGVQSVMKPLPPGVAGGRARARFAPRYDDGTFMSYDDEERIRIEQHERMARGGQARARSAKRAPDGTFL